MIGLDLNIVLWMGGMLFSLGIFAIKVGFGLGLGGIRWKGVFFTLSLYLALFITIAILSQGLISILEPVLRKGPYLHALMAAGMIGWGIVLLGKPHSSVRPSRYQSIKEKDHATLTLCHPALCHPDTQEAKSSLISRHSSLLLLVPCPVCLTAITFSTWSALNVIKLPSALVGLGLGIVFILLSLGIYFPLKLRSFNSLLITQKIGLGLSMITIGLYFIGSLILPRKIEEAKAVYKSFITEGNGIALNNSIGVFALLFAVMILGYFVNKKSELKK